MKWLADLCIALVAIALLVAVVAWASTVSAPAYRIFTG